MLSLTTIQQGIIDSAFKKVDWLFDVTDLSGAVYHWSTKDVSAGSSETKWNTETWQAYVHWESGEGCTYTFKIIDFNGVEMYRSKAELALIAPNDMTFSVVNPNLELIPRHFIGGTVRLALRVSDGTNSEVIRRWRWVIKKTEPEYQKFRVICKDFLTDLIRGDYPNTKLIRSLFDNSDTDTGSDNVCVPVPFGTPFIPLRSVYISDAITVTGTDISFVATASGSRCLVKRSGSTDFSEFESGRYVTIAGSTSNNGSFLVQNVSADLIELSETAGLTDEAAGDTVTLTQGSRYYILGPDDHDYVIHKVRSPRVWGRKSTWSRDDTGVTKWAGITSSVTEIPYNAYSFKEVDIAADRVRVVDANTVEVINIDDADEVYFYLDKGLGYFNGNFEFHLDFKCNSSALQSPEGCCIWALSNTVGTSATQITSDSLNLRFLYNITGYGFSLSAYSNGVFTSGGNQATGYDYPAAGVQYYLVIKYDLSANTIYCHIYTDKEHTVLLDTMWVPLSKRPSFRYLYWMASKGSTATGRAYNAIISNLHQAVTINQTDSTSLVWQSGVVWETPSNFPQSDQSDGTDTWRAFQPIIADANNDGTADSCGVWSQGDTFLDMPTQFSRSDLIIKTNPADILDYILSDIGVNISRASLGSAKTTYDSWGLEWNGACWYKENRRKLLARLLVMCNSNLVMGEEMELQPLSSTSRKTITNFEILKTNDVGEGTYQYADIRPETVSDCGQIAWQPASESQDKFLKVLVPASGTRKTYISGEILDLQWVQHSQNAQRLGTLYYQRKLMAEATVSFSAKATCLALNPGDVVTIEGPNYTVGDLIWDAGIEWMNAAFWDTRYPVVIDSMRINKDASVNFSCSKYSCPLDDWDDVSPNLITPLSDDITNLWAPAITGGLSDQNLASNLVENVKTYLTVGPNTNQGDYSDIQAAVNSLKDKNYTGVFLKAGDYYLDSAIYLPNHDIEIIGESKEKTRLFNYPDTSGIICSNPISAVLDSFTFMSRNTKDNLSLVGHVYITRANNVIIKNIVSRAFSIQPGSFASVGDYSFYIGGVESDKVKLVAISNCEIYGGSYGIYLSNLIESRIESCYLEGTTTYGILSSAESSLITSCSITDFNYYGIFTSWASPKTIISNNLVKTSGIIAEAIRGAGDNVVVQNNAVNITAGGTNATVYTVRIEEAGGGVCSNNSISFIGVGAHSVEGITLNLSNNINVNGNRIYISNTNTTAEHIGISLYGSDRNIIDGNNIDVVNNDAKDIGINLNSTSDNNTGGGATNPTNLTYNTPTSVDDTEGGTGNTVTAKDV